MTRTPLDDALADEIIAFFKAEFGKDLVIEPAWNGAGFETSSFWFEISYPTRAEVALAYFSSFRYGYWHALNNRWSNLWLDGGHIYRREEKERARYVLAVLDAWGAKHLRK